MPGDLNAGQTVALIVTVVIAVGGVRLLPLIWRGELASTYDHASREVWLWGEPLRRGFIRGLHLGISGTVVMVVLVFATADLEPTGSMSAVAGTGVGLLFALLVLYGSVILFNRPRWAVPPYARNEPGAVHEWRERSRQRHDRRRAG